MFRSKLGASRDSIGSEHTRLEKYPKLNKRKVLSLLTCRLTCLSTGYRAIQCLFQQQVVFNRYVPRFAMGPCCISRTHVQPTDCLVTVSIYYRSKRANPCFENTFQDQDTVFPLITGYSITICPIKDKFVFFPVDCMGQRTNSCSGVYNASQWYLQSYLWKLPCFLD